MANRKQSPFPWVGAAVNLVGGIVNYAQANKEAKKAEDRYNTAMGEFNQMKDVYSSVDTSNPFENITNQFAGMENTMEDLTVNQQQADFQAQQFQQSQANIMSGLRGAAGGSGIAALAQTLARQGQLASQQSAVSIGQQEAANQKAAMQQEANLQMKERSGAQQVQQQIAQGQQFAQQQEMQKQQTLMNLAGDQMQFAQQQQANADARKSEALSGMIGGVGDLAGSFF
jgi:hypothetical protein